MSARRLRTVAKVGPSVPGLDPTEAGKDISFLPLERIWSDGRFDPSEVIEFHGNPDSYNRVAEGDVLVPKVSPTFAHGRTTIASGLKNEVALATSEVFVVRPHDERDNRFLKYRMLSTDFISEGVASWTGVAGLKRISSDFIRNTVIDDRAWEHRLLIADHLDAECGRVGTFVENAKRSIALLHEARKAVITEAVTCGLDPSVRMKESGEASVGAIPEHWQLVPIRFVGQAIIGLTYDPTEIVLDGQGGTLVLRSGNIQDARIALNDNVYVSTAIPSRLRLQPKDIVICARNGSARLIGKNAMVTEEVLGETWGAFMAVLRSPINDYLRWILNSEIFRAQAGLFETATINQLTSSTLHGLRFALPPEDEQAAIARSLSQETDAIDAAIRTEKRAIELAEEYRASLITECVSGEFDADRMSDGAMSEQFASVPEGTSS